MLLRLLDGATIRKPFQRYYVLATEDAKSGPSYDEASKELLELLTGEVRRLAIQG